MYLIRIEGTKWDADLIKRALRAYGDRSRSRKVKDACESYVRIIDLRDYPVEKIFPKISQKFSKNA